MENKIVFVFMLATMLTTVAEPFTSNEDVIYVENILPDTQMVMVGAIIPIFAHESPTIQTQIMTTI